MPTLSSLVRSRALCPPLPQGEAVGAVRQVEEPADVQMGDEYLGSQPVQVSVICLPFPALPLVPFSFLPPRPAGPSPGLIFPRAGPLSGLWDLGHGEVLTQCTG